jgi:hypothetical protein
VLLQNADIRGSGTPTVWRTETRTLIAADGFSRGTRLEDAGVGRDALRIVPVKRFAGTTTKPITGP